MLPLEPGVIFRLGGGGQHQHDVDLHIHSGVGESFRLKSVGKRGRFLDKRGAGGVRQRARWHVARQELIIQHEQYEIGLVRVVAKHFIVRSTPEFARRAVCGCNIRNILLFDHRHVDGVDGRVDRRGQVRLYDELADISDGDLLRRIVGHQQVELADVHHLDDGGAGRFAVDGVGRGGAGRNRNQNENKSEGDETASLQSRDA